VATNDISPEGYLPSTPPDPATLAEASAAAAAEAKAKKKREKVRSAWISFAGRIVAQLVGAVATIALGIMVVQRYGVGTVTPDSDTAPRQSHNATGAVDRPQRSHGRPIVVVLPFANFSTDGGLEPLVDGLTESLVAELSRAGSLGVVSRTSSMHYKGSRKALREIARELDVDLVVEGSVASSKERIRIVAQLIDAAADEHLWAESYERELGDPLKLQDSIARLIAQEVNRAAATQLLSTSERFAERARTAVDRRLLAGR
jgi:TolB-like protein